MNLETDITIILVNYNTADLLDDCLSAVRRSAKGLSYNIVIVDNASRDGSVPLIRERHSDCMLIVNDVNVGFGRANNQALKFISGRYILLLNTDAFVSDNTLVATLEYMDANEDVGILGVKLIGRDGILQPSCRYFPTPWNIFVGRTGLSRYFPYTRLVDDMGWDHATARSCDWVPGCYYLIRRQVIDQIGLFDPAYFLYYEEVDHCMAAKKAGWLVCYFPHTSVIHLGGESTRADNEVITVGRQIERLKLESEFIFFRKNYGLTAVLKGLALIVLADFIFLAKDMIRKRKASLVFDYAKHMALAWRLCIRTRLGTRPTL